MLPCGASHLELSLTPPARASSFPSPGECGVHVFENSVVAHCITTQCGLVNQGRVPWGGVNPGVRVSPR